MQIIQASQGPSARGQVQRLCGAKTSRRVRRGTRCADHKCKSSTRHADRSIKRACLRREVPTDREAHSRNSSGCRRARVQVSARSAFGGRRPEAEARHVKHARIRTLVNPLWDSSLSESGPAQDGRRARRLVSPADHAQHVK